MVFHASSMILCCNQYTKDDLRVQDGILRKYICLFPIILFKCICIGQISCFARFHPLSLLLRGGFGCFSLLRSFSIHFPCFSGANLDFFPCHARFPSTFLASTGRIWTFSLAMLVFHPLYLLRRSNLDVFLVALPALG